MLNEAMFAGTDGWVLKPAGYLSTGWAAESTGPQVERHTLDLTIEVRAAQGLCHSEPGRESLKLYPYVKVELHVENAPMKEDEDSSSDKGSFKRRSKTSSGVDPDFTGTRFQFLEIPNVVEALSFVRYVCNPLTLLSCRLFPPPICSVESCYETVRELFSHRQRASSDVKTSAYCPHVCACRSWM